MQSKKTQVIAALSRQNILTLDEAVGLIGYGIYHNERKYVGEYLAKMVKDGLLERVKPGVFKLAQSKDKDLFNK